MPVALKPEFPLDAAAAGRCFMAHYEAEWGLEIDRHNPDVLRQFRDIKELSMSFSVFSFGGGVADNHVTVPRAARIISRRLSNHLNWVACSDDELACHHSRDVRMLACYLSIAGVLNARYRDRAVKELSERIARSDDRKSVFMMNIQERINVLSGLAVADANLPEWPSPKEVADRIRGHRALGVFNSAGDVVEAVHEARGN